MKTQTFTGTVLDTAGDPWADALVELQFDDGSGEISGPVVTAVTGVDGTFSIDAFNNSDDDQVLLIRLPNGNVFSVPVDPDDSTVDAGTLESSGGSDAARLSEIPGGVSGTIPVKASGAEVDTGTNDAKFLTPKAIEDSDYIKAAAVTSLITAAVAGLLDDRGNYNASGNTFPASGGSGAAGAILKGDLWYISVQGTLGGVVAQVGSTVRALTDSPGQTAGNWDILNIGIGYTPLSATDVRTVTNKRITKRVVTVTESATPTINTDNTDVASITGLAQAITSMTTNLSGTPVAGDDLIVEITDDGTARAITWGASFGASTVALPTTTVISTLLTVAFRWNAATSKWRCVGVA